MRTESLQFDELPASSLFPFGVSKSEGSQLEELRMENAGLRRLVGELLVANQQLRERYGVGRREGLDAASSGSSRGEERTETLGRSGDLADGR